MNRNRKITAVAGLMLAVFIACTAESCYESDPSPDSDSAQNYATDSKVPVDDNVYDITGVVTAAPSSVTRQTDPGGGTINTPFCMGSGGCYGGGGGTITGPVEKGKGYVRLTVTSAKPTTDLAPAGALVILKTSDTKVTALVAGDTATFRCRRQYEAIAAVKDDETFSKDKVATWELDYCRLATPVLKEK